MKNEDAWLSSGFNEAPILFNKDKSAVNKKRYKPVLGAEAV